jgi:hypothetical protein
LVPKREHSMRTAIEKERPSEDPMETEKVRLRVREHSMRTAIEKERPSEDPMETEKVRLRVHRGPTVWRMAWTTKSVPTTAGNSG